MIVALVLTVVALLVRRHRKNSPGPPSLFRPRSLFESAPVARRDSSASVGIIMDDLDIEGASLPVAETALPIGAIVVSPSPSASLEDKSVDRSSFNKAALVSDAAVADRVGGSGGDVPFPNETLNPAHQPFGAPHAAGATGEIGAGASLAHGPDKGRKGIKLKKKKKKAGHDREAAAAAIAMSRASRLAVLKQAAQVKQRPPKRKSQPKQQLR